MREIGVRELKRSLSATLAAVIRGEQVRVTRRGRPVAVIVPATGKAGDDRLRALAADGRVALPSRARPDRPPPPAEAEGSASAVVLAEREAER